MDYTRVTKKEQYFVYICANLNDEHCVKGLEKFPRYGEQLCKKEWREKQHFITK